MSVVMKLTPNETDASVRERLAQAISGGYDFADTLHNVYLDFGYPATITFSYLWNMYRRFGIARNAVELPVDTTWMTFPTVDGTKRFQNEFEKLAKRVSLWQRMKGLDTRQRVGRYAGFYMRVKDGLDPSLPIKGTLPGSAALVSIMPLHEGQLQVQETDHDPRSETFDQPIMYRYHGAGVGDRNEQTQSSFQIHPSRIVIAAEGADDGSIYGIPILEACYNSLMDLRKIIGAGGEGFYKNAAQSIIFHLEDTANAAINEDLLTEFNEVYDEFAKNRQRRGLWTPGLKPVALDSKLADPINFFQNALQDVAAAVGIPSTILIGQQTGRLASNEDSRSFLSGVNSRRAHFGTEMVTNFIEWCMKYGVLPSSRYEIYWDDLLALSDSEKLSNANKMADINKKHSSAGMGGVFSVDEVRELTGRKPNGGINVEKPENSGSAEQPSSERRGTGVQTVEDNGSGDEGQ